MADERDLFDVWLTARLRGVRERAELAAPPPPLARRAARRAVAGVVAALFVAAASVAALVTVALVAHRGAPAAVPPPPATAVPWRDIRASGAVSPVTVPGVVPCAAGDLQITFPVDPNAGGAADTSTWLVRVRDVSKRACFMAPTLNITFVAPSGPMHLAPWAAAQSFVDILYLSSALSAGPQPPYPSFVDGEIGTSGGCTMPAGTTMVIDLGPTLGTVAVDPGAPVSAGSVCGVGQAPAGGYYAELRPPDNGCTVCPGFTPATAIHPQYMAPAINAPSLVHPGDRVRFLVTVVNSYIVGSSIGPEPTPPPLTLQACATYQEELEGTVGSAVLYQLNCADARPIASGGRETFEMYLAVPVTAPYGSTILSWVLTTPLGQFTGRHFLEVGPRPAPKTFPSPPPPTPCVPVTATPPREPVTVANQGGPFGGSEDFMAGSSWVGTVAVGKPTYGVWSGTTTAPGGFAGVPAVTVYRFELTSDGCAYEPVPVGVFTESSANGRLTISSVSGARVALATPSGQRWVFDLGTHRFSRG